MSARRWIRSLAAAALAALLPVAAHAQGAASDSLLQRYFGSMADSTDAYFGIAAQQPDTTGLDSALTWRLANPGKAGRGRAGRVTLRPAFDFNRAVGAMYGGGADLSLGSGRGTVGGTLQWANGPNVWFGHGGWTLRRLHGADDDGWTLKLSAGRRAEAFNRDYFNASFALVSALFYGGDRHSYLRRDGVRASYAYRTGAWNATAAYRNELESPLATTATWTLTGADADPAANGAAAFGRASELSLAGSVKLPWAPFTVEGTAWNAGGVLGGDLAYHRYRAAAGGALALGRHVAFVPQFEYARLTGAALPQDVLYLGGQYSLLSLDSQSLQGTGRAVGRADVVVHDDVLELLRLRHHPAFPIQLGAFAATASRWGYDPATGVAKLTDRHWPGSEQWMSEAGVSLMYRPGLPDPETFFRVDYVWPLGPGGREPGIQVSWKRTLHLLRNR